MKRKKKKKKRKGRKDEKNEECSFEKEQNNRYKNGLSEKQDRQKRVK